MVIADPRPRRLLSAAEEVALAVRIARGDRDAKERMIEGNLRLVCAVARNFRGRGVPYEDLVQEGNIGLLRAVERFDPHRGSRFSTYAIRWIRSSILEAIADGGEIRIPAKANRQLALVRRAEFELARRGPRRPSHEQIAEYTHLSVTKVRTLRDAARVTASLDETVGEDAASLAELVPDTRAADPSEVAIARERRHEMAAILRLVPDRHREVLVRRYGLNGGTAQSHEDIGKWLGVGEQRSRQLEREALNRLRSVMTPSRRAA